MLSWSTYFQSPDYLDLYRKMLMDNDYLPLICKWMHLKDNMNILDVGCGTGALCFYLSKHLHNCSFYGIDIDTNFLKSAKEKSLCYNSYNNSNKFTFIYGDANKIPFLENYFDAVISYTALTNIPNGNNVISEMERVVRPSGFVSSITSQSFSYNPLYEGNYDSNHSCYLHKLKFLTKKVNNMYNSIQPINDYYMYGTPPEKIPLLFASSSLYNIEMHPIGCSFSLSNNLYSTTEKIELIDLMYRAEKNKFQKYMELDEARKYISYEEENLYLELLALKNQTQKLHIEDDKSWEWFGGAQLLMCGQKQGNY